MQQFFSFHGVVIDSLLDTFNLTGCLFDKFTRLCCNKTILIQTFNNPSINLPKSLG